MIREASRIQMPITYRLMEVRDDVPDSYSHNFVDSTVNTDSCISLLRGSL